jgi:hypothetical protein
MSAKIQELICKASMSHSEVERNEGEKILFELMYRDYQSFLLECMNIFLTSTVDVQVRSATSYIMTMALKEPVDSAKEGSRGV